MSATQSSYWSHSNRYAADSACEHCAGVIRHEAWCITHNTEVRNAWWSVLDPEKLGLQDQLILHALGVAWTKSCGHKACEPATT